LYIDEGQVRMRRRGWLGARLELSRVFMEVGERLSEKKSRYKELNGINA
jgi:hypothetical protein